ncbi:MAG: hypothetical protein ETSY1_13080 [Candidatus Entotheonella factor]|uniref:Uncharacterized protein n=1 Tax=Entotheonella factor TaxID=1429438 RepID=W4LPF6_ENTF1|nr:MAG: hypothetical protein ETSY1_13080 [Candidatus Entotheonella factor]
MKFAHDGMSLWYGTPDAPAPTEIVTPDESQTVIVAVHPIDASNQVDICYGTEPGMMDQSVGAKWLWNDTVGDVQYFQAMLPAFMPGERVAYTAVCRRAGRQVPHPDQMAPTCFEIQTTPSAMTSPDHTPTILPGVNTPMPTAASTGSLNRKHLYKVYKQRLQQRGSEVYELVIKRMDAPGNSQRPIPQSVTLLRPNPTQSSHDQLFVDQTPVPREVWHYDATDRILSWEGADEGGRLHLFHDGTGAVGVVGSGMDLASISAGIRARFSCDVALNCGAKYVTSGSAVTDITWAPTSDQWKNAHWQTNRLLLSYTYHPGSGFQPPTFTFDFQDQITDGIPWDPTQGAFEAALQLGTRSSQTVWDLTFKSVIPPPLDPGSPSGGPDTVFPQWLKAVEDAAASRIDGAFVIDGEPPHGTLVGLQGQRASGMIVGYYQTAKSASPFGIFHGQLMLNGQPAGKSQVNGNQLHWTGLSEAYQRRTGLPESGCLVFRRDGGSAQDGNGLAVQRLHTTGAIDAIADHSDLHPDVYGEP